MPLSTSRALWHNSPGPMNPRPRFGALFFCVILLAALAFGRAAEAPFIWDDEALIVGNPWLGHLSALPRFFTPAYWRGLSFAEDYRPVEMASYWFDHAFWDENPFGYHASNVLLHAFNCAALVALAWLLFGSAPIAAAAGVLFALHPMHSEAVVWVQNRSELLSSAFSLICLCAFARWTAGEGPAPGVYALACASLALACLSKESAAAAPLICASMLRAPVARRGRAWAGLIPLAALAAAFMAVKIFLLPYSRPGHSASLLVGAYPRAAVVAKTLALYLAMLALPARFSLDRFFEVPPFPPSPSIIIGAAAAAMAFVAALRGFARKEPWAPAAALALFPLLPVSNVVFISGRPLAEQRLYLASAGFCLCAAFLIERSSRAPRARAGAAFLTVALAASWLTASVMRTDYWRNERVLWERTLETSPWSWRSRLFLSHVYAREGRHDDAVGLLKEILRYTEPRHSSAFVELGRIYASLGWEDRALGAYERAVGADPSDGAARVFLGDALRRGRRFDEALAQFREVERRFPGSGRGRLGAAGVLKEKRDYAAALAELREVLALNPRNPPALVSAATVHAALGEDAEAERRFAEALSLAPKSAAALNSLGLFRERRGRREEALALYARAAALDQRAWTPRYNMAVVHREAGRPAEALAALMEAAALQPGRVAFLEEINRLSDSIAGAVLTPAQWKGIGAAHALLLQARGIYCARTGDAEGAIDCFGKLAALQPENGEARANLGRVYAGRGEYRRAIAELRAAAALLPDSAPVYSSLGSCCAALGLRHEAERAWRTAMRLDPRAKEPRRNLARLRRL